MLQPKVAGYAKLTGALTPRSSTSLELRSNARPSESGVGTALCCRTPKGRYFAAEAGARTQRKP